LELDSWKNTGLTELGEDGITSVEICKFGVPFEPSDFVQKAIQAGHPKDLLAQVSSLLSRFT
jgi:hypothetical protein